MVKHYPPAETKIPWRSFLNALRIRHRDLRTALCLYLKVDNCLLAESGRAALSLLLDMLRFQRGTACNEVLLPAYTCYSVAAAVVRSGLKIRVYDIDPSNLSPDMSSVRKTKGEGTLVVVGQHLFGLPTDLSGLQTWAGEEGAIFLEDAAQGLGGLCGERMLGTIGDVGLFSFGRGKPLPLGCGGAIIASDREIFLDKIPIHPKGIGCKQLLMATVVQILAHKRLYGIMESLPLGLGDTTFDPSFSTHAMPLCMNRLGSNALWFLEALNEHRCSRARDYHDIFQGKGTIPIPAQNKPVYTRYPVLAGHGDIPNELRRYGVRRMYPKPISDDVRIQPYLSSGNPPIPGAREIADRLITLPTHHQITRETAYRIGNQVLEAFALK